MDCKKILVALDYFATSTVVPKFRIYYYFRPCSLENITAIIVFGTLVTTNSEIKGETSTLIATVSNYKQTNDEPQSDDTIYLPLFQSLNRSNFASHKLNLSCKRNPK